MKGSEKFGVLLLLLMAGIALVACTGSEKVSPAAAGRGPSVADKKEARIPDLRLRLDLLQKPVRRINVGRNIFEYQVRAAASPPMTPPVVASTPPTPPPPAPLRFYGFAEDSQSGQKRVFLTDGEEIFIASEGETLLRRYRITRVRASSIELEDVVGRRNWVLPLEQP